MRFRLPKDRWLPVIPGLLLVVVALQQIVLHTRADISPWKGGGFGMFSSSEGGWTRHSHVFLSSPEGELEVDLPEDLEDLEARVRVLPSASRVEQFAGVLSETLASDYPQHSGVRIELWRSRFDPVDLMPTTELMREHLQPRQPDDGA